MIWKLAYKNILRAPIMNLLMVLQMIVIFFITISMTSSILSRFAYFLPFKDLLKNDGDYYNMLFSYDPETLDPNFKTEELTAKLRGDPKAAASYLPWLSVDGVDAELCSFDDPWLDAYRPELEDGTWFDLDGWQKDTIPIVISDNDEALSVGDQITMTDFASGSKYSCEIIGILKEGARVIGWDSPGASEDFSCKYMYRDHYFAIEQKMLVIMPQRLLAAEQIGTQLHDPLLITYPDGVSAEDRSYNDSYIKSLQTIFNAPVSEIYQNSLVYIFEQCRALLPILFAVLLLTLVSTMSVNALSVKRQIYTYTIYYICGLRWNKCVLINLVSSFYLVLLSLLLTFAGIAAALPALGESVIRLGWIQLLACMVVLVFYVILSVVLPLRIMHSHTPSEILRSY